MKRVVLFILTNLAVILILTVVLRLLGVDRILDEQGIDLEMTNLLAFAAGGAHRGPRRTCAGPLARVGNGFASRMRPALWPRTSP